MKIAVAQFGARRGYAVPEIFARAGALSLLFTDAAGNVGFCRLLSSLARRLPPNHPFARLAARRVPEILAARTISFPVRSLAHAARLRRPMSDERRFELHLAHSRTLGSAMARHGFGDATYLYSMLGEAGPVLEAAKAKGLTVVADVYINLDTVNIIERERELFRDWHPEPVLHPQKVMQAIGYKDYLLDCTDFFICPSETVRDDLVTRLGVAVERTAVVPFGVDRQAFSNDVHPLPGRVLFAGTADLRKGIHYLAMAADVLRGRGRRYEFRVAGHAGDSVRSRPECAALGFLGRVPRSAMRDEFARADVLVLPTLAEGSAMVTYEALAAGVPVITTAAAGSVVRDGIDGQIVPEREPVALADAIEEIVEDRDKRQRMSHAARRRASDHTWAHYGDRLLAALAAFSAPVGANCQGSSRFES